MIESKFGPGCHVVFTALFLKMVSNQDALLGQQLATAGIAKVQQTRLINQQNVEIVFTVANLNRAITIQVDPQQLLALMPPINIEEQPSFELQLEPDTQEVAPEEDGGMGDIPDPIDVARWVINHFGNLKQTAIAQELTLRHHASRGEDPNDDWKKGEERSAVTIQFSDRETSLYNAGLYRLEQFLIGAPAEKV